MAELDVTSSTAKIPAGPYWMQTFRCTTGAGSAAEYITTGFSWIHFVVGDAILGAVEGDKTNNYVPNAAGTGETEGSTKGALGIETEAAKSIEVTVLGT